LPTQISGVELDCVYLEFSFPRAQIELADKDRSEDERHRHQRKAYSENLQRQIRENELVRIGERKAFFEEGVKLDDEARARRAKLDDIKRKKLEELR